MSMRYKGAVISATPPTLSPNAGGSGAWTLEQQMQAKAAGLWPKNGPFNYIEDVFSTWLYTGTGSAQTITNGIDLAGKGGLVWIKNRTGAQGHNLYDTARGRDYLLRSNSTAAQAGPAGSTNDLTAFNSNGFSLGVEQYSNTNDSAFTYASWTFRKQPKFFDVVTFSGDDTGARTIPHSLASVPGCIIVKKINTTSDWNVYHRGLTSAANIVKLNTTAAQAAANGAFNSTAPTSSVFTVGSGQNILGENYVAYLFAHNAGGFGLSGTDNVISCGSFTTDGSGAATVNLGYEPQWLLVKGSSGVTNWLMADNMRGWSETNIQRLFADTSSADSNYTADPGHSPTATGFKFTAGLLSSSTTYIYIAIRRGPMAVPTTGTSVFVPQVVAESTTGPNYTNTITSGFPVDWVFTTTSVSSRRWGTRLAGNATLQSNLTAAESNFGLQATVFDSNTSAGIVATLGSPASAYMYAFRRATGFMDVVCYTASSSQLTLNHNLGVAPEMIITKARSNADDWYVWCQHNSSIATGACISLNSNSFTASAGGGALSSITASSFNTFLPGITGWTAVSYLFASAPGVSKVGSFTGTGATQVINCGFTSGARFVLIKSTNTAGDWLVWDSARGIVAGNDPYLLLNSTAAEVTDTDWVDTAATGFELSNAVGNLANSSGVSYIFLAIA